MLRHEPLRHIGEPATGRWSTTESAPVLFGDQLTRLPDGRIALTGEARSAKRNGFWLRDPSSDDFEPGSANPPRIWRGHQAYVNDEGLLIISGGDRGPTRPRAVRREHAWDPLADLWGWTSLSGPACRRWPDHVPPR
jgi:hypothetical protein